jgi:hypothetical protein
MLLSYCNVSFSFFLPYSDIFLPTHCGCRGLLLHLITLSDTHTHTHTRYDSSERVISPTQKPLPDNTDIHRRHTSMPPAGFEPEIRTSEWPHFHALDRAANFSFLEYRSLRESLFHSQSTCYLTSNRGTK